MGWPQAAPIIEEGILDPLVPRMRLHAGFLWAVGLAVFTWAFIRFSRWGFQIRAVGHNPEAAAFAGLPVGATVLRTALLSGGLAGMAGENGRASCRERVCQYVYIPVVAGSLNKKKIIVTVTSQNINK